MNTQKYPPRDVQKFFILYSLSIVPNCQLGSLDRKCKLSVFEFQVHVQKTGITCDGGLPPCTSIGSCIGKGITGAFSREPEAMSFNPLMTPAFPLTVDNSITQEKTNWKARTVPHTSLLSMLTCVAGGTPPTHYSAHHLFS